MYTGTQLRAIRLRMGVSQNRLAQRLGTKQASLSRWEKQGEKPLKLPIQARLDGLLNTSAHCPQCGFQTALYRPDGTPVRGCRYCGVPLIVSHCPQCGEPLPDDPQQRFCEVCREPLTGMCGNEPARGLASTGECP